MMLSCEAEAWRIFRTAVNSAVEAGVRREELARRLEIAPATLNHWMSVTDQRVPTWPVVFRMLADEGVLPEDVRAAAIQALMRELGIVGGGAPITDVGLRELGPAQLGMRVASATGGLCTELAAATAPGSAGGDRVTPEEAERISAAAVDVQRAAVAVEVSAGEAVGGGARDGKGER